jgi:hypothetical protein
MHGADAMRRREEVRLGIVPSRGPYWPPASIHNRAALNGDIRLMLYLAKPGRLPWDAILGAEIAQAYKLPPDAYLRIHRHPLAFAP